MIRGLHGLFYSSDADATRAFLRDKLQLPHTDVGGGWLIFDLPEADLGVHPLGDGGGGPPAGAHDVSFYCDDIQGTVADLRARGVEFQHDPQDHGYGWVTYFTIPGGLTVQLYEPKYAKRAASRPAKVAAKAKATAKAVVSRAKAAVARAKGAKKAKSARAAKPAKSAKPAKGAKPGRLARR